MAKPRHYSPQIARFMVSVLYHEAKARKLPMTKLTDEMLRQSLMNSEGWRQVESTRLAESPTPYPAPSSQA